MSVVIHEQQLFTLLNFCKGGGKKKKAIIKTLIAKKVRDSEYCEVRDRYDDDVFMFYNSSYSMPEGGLQQAYFFKIITIRLGIYRDVDNRLIVGRSWEKKEDENIVGRQGRFTEKFE